MRSIGGVVLAAIGIGAAVVTWRVSRRVARPVIAWAVSPIGGDSSRGTQNAKANCSPRSAIVAATTVVASVVDLCHSGRRSRLFQKSCARRDRSSPRREHRAEHRGSEERDGKRAFHCLLVHNRILSNLEHLKRQVVCLPLAAREAFLRSADAARSIRWSR